MSLRDPLRALREVGIYAKCVKFFRKERQGFFYFSQHQ